MRSINRGPWPTENNGRRVSFSNYRHAKVKLFKRIGDYCSYCERRGDLHVEHVVPKSKVPELETEWGNFLLGCVNCNSNKLEKNQSRRGYIWPDCGNTFGAFVYSVGGQVRVNDSLSKGEYKKAYALFNLVGLGKAGTDTDRRRHKRREAWDLAVKVSSIDYRRKASGIGCRACKINWLLQCLDGRVQ